MYGHNGKIMWVDLTRREIREELYNETFARMFLGGNGFAAKMIHDTVPPDGIPTDGKLSELGLR